jgi:putative intracellular protease/amidase
MPSVLMAVTGSDVWTFADGERHPCGYWPEELVAPHRVFTAAGLDVTIATPGGVAPTADEAGFTPEMNNGSTEAGPEMRAYIASIGSALGSPAVLEDLDVRSYDIVFVPGGHGPMEDLAVSPSFGAQLRAAHDAGRIISAVCHGPAALLPARSDDGSWLFSGYQVTGFTNTEEGQVGYAGRAAWLLEDRLRAGGGKFENADPWQARVVVDRNLYTGQNPASSGPLAERLVAAVHASTA